MKQKESARKWTLRADSKIMEAWLYRELSLLLYATKHDI